MPCPFDCYIFSGWSPCFQGPNWCDPMGLLDQPKPTCVSRGAQQKWPPSPSLCGPVLGASSGASVNGGEGVGPCCWPLKQRFWTIHRHFCIHHPTTSTQHYPKSSTPWDLSTILSMAMHISGGTGTSPRQCVAGGLRLRWSRRALDNGPQVSPSQVDVFTGGVMQDSGNH